MNTEDWYDNSYRTKGFAAQRLYPNEELLRFMGTNLFHLDADSRLKTKILEVGCGSCSNLWMIAREGFDAYGIDLSAEGIALGTKMLAKWQTRANLKVGSMVQLPYEANTFDAIVDVLSACCLPMAEFEKYLDEVFRCLKPGGMYFSITPSVNSDLWENYYPAERIDQYTLSGILNPTSPLYPQDYPFRVTSVYQSKRSLEQRKFKVSYCETVSRTYRSLSEYFECVVAVGTKP